MWVKVCLVRRVLTFLVCIVRIILCKMSKVSVEPWVTALIDDLTSTTREKILQLGSIIQKMGVDENSREEWIAVIKEQTAETYGGLVDDALAIQSKLLDSIEELLKRSSELCKLLKIQMPQYGSEDLNFYEEREMLRKKVCQLEAVVTVRKQELDTLKKRQLEACKSLDRQPKPINESPLPSAQDLDEFTEHIKALELEVFEREDNFINLKCKIVEIANELGIKPTLDIEKIVLSSDDAAFKVTDSNMEWIENYHVSLQNQREDIKLEIQNLRECVSILWGKLSEDIKVCNGFLQSHIGNSIDTLEAWKLEWKRCEKLKKANIEKFVKELRKDLSVLWERCHLTNSQRDEFEYFHCTFFTEDLLTFHDMEVKKLQRYYEENKETFTLLEKWQQSWNKMIDLEERACAPNRFKNRGGTLLKEEKERNLLRKRLPEYEDRLVDLANNYQSRSGKPFLSWGETIKNLISNMHGNYKTQKENKLSSRKQQRSQQVTTPGKSTIALNSVMSASKPQLSAQKRPPLTPLFSNRKKTKVETAKEVPIIKLNDQTMKRRTRTSLERQRHLRKIRTISKNIKSSKESFSLSDTMEYDIFKKGMSSKGACRSTLFKTSSCELVFPQTPTYTELKAMPGSSFNI